jgi:hypothetical protein
LAAKAAWAALGEWRTSLLASGVSVSMAAKAYRLLRAVLMTAVKEDKILTRNPCRIRGAGDEEAAERPVLTVAQVFALAELVGRKPVGNIRRTPAGSYRLRFQRHVLAWAFVVERVTRIEVALSAWEAERLRLFDVLTWQIRCSVVTVVDPSSPRLMAR